MFGLCYMEQAYFVPKVYKPILFKKEYCKMFNKTKRLLAFALATVLVFSLAGCKKSADDTSSGGVEVITQIEYQDGDSTTSGGTTSGSTTSGGTKKPGKNNSPGSGATNKDGLINDNVDPTKYRGTTVKFAATIDPAVDESGPVVKAFEQKYGIKVEIVASDQGDYANQMAGLIAAGKSPDVARVNGDFPTCMGYLQSLTAAKLNYKESIWKQHTFKLSTFGGEPYFCDTVGNIWAEIDIVIYSKRLLKSAGANTPEEYDKAGKWTWDAYYDICRKVKALGSNMQGGGFNSRENAIYGAGGGLIVYKDGKFVNGVNQRTEEAMIKYTTAWKEGILGWKSTDGIIDGTVGITTVHAWALKKTGFFNNTAYNTDDLGFYYLPRWDSNSDYGCTGMVRGWGIIRGASNPVAAGIFLREYLDVSNYDTSSTFISDAAEKFFFEVNSVNYDNWNPCILYYGYNDGIAGSDMNEHNMAMSGDPSQVGTAMASIKSSMDRACANINKFVSQNIGLR